MKSRLLVPVVTVAAGAMLVAAPSASAHPRRFPHVHRGAIVRMRVEVSSRRPLQQPLFIGGRPMGLISFHVEPEEATILVDGVYRPGADRFDLVPSAVPFEPGSHVVVLRTADGHSWAHRVRVSAGEEIDIRVELDD